MKACCILYPVLLGAILLAVSGCKQDSSVDATQPLQQSFQAAEPEVQKAIQTATTSLKSGNYLEATQTLTPVVSGRPLSDSQKQAVGLAIQQINQAIAADPSLDTPEMYKLRKKLFEAVHNGPRF